MRPRPILMLLIALCSSIDSLAMPAQSKESPVTAIGAYENWRSTVLAKRESTAHYAVAVTLRREGAQSTADLAVVGDMEGFKLSSRPVLLAPDQSMQLAGETATLRQEIPAVLARRQIPSQPQIVQTVSLEATGLEIQMESERSPFPVLLTLYVPFRKDGINQAVFGIHASKTDSSSSCPAECFTASLTCSNGCTISRQCKYGPNCEANYSANCSTCSITCSNGQCRLNE